MCTLTSFSLFPSPQGRGEGGSSGVSKINWHFFEGMSKQAKSHKREINVQVHITNDFSNLKHTHSIYKKKSLIKPESYFSPSNAHMKWRSCMVLILSYPCPTVRNLWVFEKIDQELMFDQPKVRSWNQYFALVFFFFCTLMTQSEE